MSTFGSENPAVFRIPARAAVRRELRHARHRPVGLLGARGGADDELAIRFAAVRLGYRLGWVSIVVVLAGLALDAGLPHRRLLVVVTLVAAAGNAVAILVPSRDWLATRRGRLFLDLWCGGLIAFVAVLVVGGGSSFSLLVFLTAPFIAVVQTGRRRNVWLAVAGATCLLVAASTPVSAGATVMRLGLVAATVAVVLGLTRTIRLEASAHARAAARAELERTLTREANHRIKNDLQTAADLLLLGRPDGTDGTAFDETAARIRSIATVHRLLTETRHRVDGAALLHGITASVPVPVTVEAGPAEFDAATAQKLGIVANELVTNAFRHGAPPIVLRLESGRQTRLSVDDQGGRIEGAGGFGLELVQRLVEQGLHGQFELRALLGGGTRAEVVFPTVTR